MRPTQFDLLRTRLLQTTTPSTSGEEGAPTGPQVHRCQAQVLRFPGRSWPKRSHRKLARERWETQIRLEWQRLRELGGVFVGCVYEEQLSAEHLRACVFT